MEFGDGAAWAVVFRKNLLSAGQRFAFIPGPLIESGLVGCGGIPKWPTGADCKSAGYAFTGSNPVPTTTFDAAVRIIPDRGVFVDGKPGTGRNGPLGRPGRPAHLGRPALAGQRWTNATQPRLCARKSRPQSARRGKAGKGKR